MNNEFDQRNWSAPLIGGFALLLLHVSACSRDIRPVEPLNTSQAVVAVPSDETVQKVDLRGVEFQHDGSIKSASDPVLDSALDMLKDKPGATIYVDAYCDPSGGEKLNEHLSKERAAAVASYLEKHGIPADHIVARGLGATNFVASNATHSGREQNRRIELVVRPGAAS
jgi:OmpA-OmpF porin, OOP family